MSLRDASPRTRSTLLWGTTVLLWLVAAQWAVLSARSYLFGGDPAMDAHAYWLTGQSGVGHLYGALAGSKDAFLYSPLFAQLVHVPAQLPWPVFAVVWCTIEALAFGWLLRPLGWRWGVPAFGFCLSAILVGNVFGVLAIALVLGVTGPRAAAWWSYPLLTKITPGLCGLAYLAGARRWRTLGWAVLVAALLAGASYLLSPRDWSDWVDFLRSSPTSTGLRVRTVLALVLGLTAGLTRRPWLLPVAVALASPNLGGFPALGVLAAVPRLVVHERSEKE